MDITGTTNIPPDDLLAAIDAARAAHGRLRVISIEWRGLRVWFKQTGGDNSANILMRLHAALARFLPPLLRNARIADESLSLQHEAVRLREWNKQGLPVPELLMTGPDWMLTADAGQWFLPQLAAADQSVRREYLQQALTLLQDIHKAGHAHGRPMVKDIAINTTTRKLTWLDLEENTEAVMPLAIAQARDIWIFLSSIVRYADAALLEALTSQAVNIATVETRQSLEKSLTWILPFRKLTRRIDPQTFGHEIGGILRLTDIMAAELARYRA